MTFTLHLSLSVSKLRWCCKCVHLSEAEASCFVEPFFLHIQTQFSRWNCVVLFFLGEGSTRVSSWTSAVNPTVYYYSLPDPCHVWIIGCEAARIKADPWQVLRCCFLLRSSWGWKVELRTVPLGFIYRQQNLQQGRLSVALSAAMVGLSALRRARRWSSKQRDDKFPARGSPVDPGLHPQQRRWGNTVHYLD